MVYKHTIKADAINEKIYSNTCRAQNIIAGAQPLNDIQVTEIY